MTTPEKCPRCGTERCAKQIFSDVGDSEAGLYADIACSLRLLARIQEAGLACICDAQGMHEATGTHLDHCPRGRFER